MSSQVCVLCLDKILRTLQTGHAVATPTVTEEEYEGFVAAIAVLVDFLNLYFDQQVYPYEGDTLCDFICVIFFVFFSLMY